VSDFHSTDVYNGGVHVTISVLEERVWRKSTVRCCSTIATV